MHPSKLTIHDACNCIIRFKEWNNGRLVPGLICSEHNAHIKWLSPKDAHRLIFKESTVVEPWRDTTPAKIIRKQLKQQRDKTQS